MIVAGEPGLTFRDALLIYNPQAGGLRRGGAGRVERALAILRRHGCQAAPAPTSQPGEATAIARRAAESGAGLIIAAGGDGTVNEVVNGIVGTGVPLAVLPAGTANVLGRELRLPRYIEQTAGLLPRWTPHRIACGLLSAEGVSRHFLLMAGAGLDARIASEVNLALKRRAGKLAYWVAGFAHLGRALPQFTLRAEGREFRTGFALASRVRNYGGDLEIARGASLLSECFELVVFEGESSWRYLWYLAGAASGRLNGIRGVTILHPRRVELAAGPDSALIQVDGEVTAGAPATVEIVPDAVTLLAPAGVL
jgi:diacylglycerol kinase (ATP)